MFEVDLVVVGAGPGGESVAHRALKAGLSVAVVEADLVGGECPFYGCMPAKIALRGAHGLAEAARLPQIAGAVETTPQWAVVADRIAAFTSGWDDTKAARRLTVAGGQLFRGYGRLTGDKQVRVEVADGDDVDLSARLGVVLSPGTRAAVPPITGLAETPYWTNREVVAVAELPASLIVLGGGPIGVEFAQVFARFGTDVTVVEAADRLLTNDEPEASAVIAKALADDGATVITGVGATEVSYDDACGFTMTLADGRELTAAKLLVATGRTPNLANLGLETVGLNPRELEVDKHMRVAPGLWLIGDAAGKGAFTHLAVYQAQVALADIIGEPEAASYHAVPHVTFTEPEIAGVGLTEAAARAAGVDVVVGTADLARSSRGATHGPGSEGVIKVILDRDSGHLVGATIAGPGAGEMISMLVLAVHARIPAREVASMIYAYPTFHRTIQIAVESALKKAAR